MVRACAPGLNDRCTLPENSRRTIRVVGNLTPTGSLTSVQVLHDAGPLPAFSRGTAITIGAFDGVHIGHATLIAETRRLAAELDCPSVLVTLDRHPATVVRPASAPPLLVDETQKFELLAATGIDFVLIVHFDGERSLEGSEEFVREVIVDALSARVVVVGEECRAGVHGRHHAPRA